MADMPYDQTNRNPKFLWLPYTKQAFLFTDKELLRKREGGGLKKSKQNERRLLTPLATVIKKGPTTSIRKHDNGVKVHEKTMRISIKQDLSPDLKHLITRYVFFLKQTNATSNPNIGLLKTANEDE